jgi:anti-sigma factor RsiW
MNPCPEFETLLLDQAAGALEPEGAQCLEEHLKVCPACEAEAEALAQTVALSRMPEPSSREVRALSSLPFTTLAAWRRQERRSELVRRSMIGIALAASVASFVVAPIALNKRRTPRNLHRLDVSALTALDLWGVEDANADVALGNLDDMDLPWGTEGEGEQLR